MKSTLEFLKQELAQERDEDSLSFTATCRHHSFLSKEEFQICGHCEKEFCQPCLLSHKVFLKMQTTMIASNVSFKLNLKFFNSLCAQNFKVQNP